MLYVYVGCAPWHVRGVVQGGAAQVEHGQAQQVTLQSEDTRQALQHSTSDVQRKVTHRYLNGLQTWVRNDVLPDTKKCMYNCLLLPSQPAASTFSMTVSMAVFGDTCTCRLSSSRMAVVASSPCPAPIPNDKSSHAPPNSTPTQHTQKDEVGVSAREDGCPKPRWSQWCEHGRDAKHAFLRRRSV